MQDSRRGNSNTIFVGFWVGQNDQNGVNQACFLAHYWRFKQHNAQQVIWVPWMGPSLETNVIVHFKDS